MEQRNLVYKKYFYAKRITPPPPLYKVDINAEASRSGKTLRLSVFGPVWACQLTEIQSRPFYTPQCSLCSFFLCSMLFTVLHDQ